MKQGKKALVVMVSLLLIVVLSLVATHRPLQLWPGLEGLDAGVVGYYVKEPAEYAGYYQTNERFPSDSPYEWTQWPTVDPYNTLITKTIDPWGVPPRTKFLLVERQTPTRDESLAGRQIQYWIHYGDDKMKIVGTVVPWTFTIQIALLPGTKNDDPAFENGEAVWFGLGTKKWDRAFSDPDNASVLSHAGWSIPLAVYIEKYDPYGYWTEHDGTRQEKPKTEWISECVQVTPNLDGRSVTLFSDPETPVTLDDIWYQGGLSSSAISSALGGLNSSVAFNPYPDSEFASHAYFKFTFSTFKPKEIYNWLGSLTEVWFPSVIYRIRVYYLELGEFIYVQQKDEVPPWDPREWIKVFTPVKEWWDSFFAAIGVLNPFGVFGSWAPFVAFIFTLIIIGIVILVLMAIFAPGLLARLFAGAGRARASYQREYAKGKSKKS